MTEKNKIVDVFKYRKRTIVIIEMNWFSSGQYHNGYVSCRPSSGQVNYEKTYSKINADEATYDGFLGKEWDSDKIPHDMYFLGFDSVHSWNNPTNNNRYAVTERAKKFADDMIKARF